ncbi:PEGA domain-containing protein [Candidatus Palauibacter sp.]|uniref:PEGA domain-containing protein n=1 Tax=Candidatus Palauibacter sp. TaxID=3101350 RepID=UPI003B5C2C3B
MRKHLPALFLATVSTTACASLYNDEVKAVGMYSSPAQAEVWIDGILLGETPLSLELDNQASHNVVFRKEGHADAVCELYSGVHEKWFVADLFLGPFTMFLSLIIDAVSGDWRGIRKNACNVVLPPASPVSGSESDRTGRAGTNISRNGGLS